MKTNERNWSAVHDYRFTGIKLPAYLTREEWLEQVRAWYITDPQVNFLEWHIFNEMADTMTDEELIGYIAENWQIEIRETTWLKPGNSCWCSAYDCKVKILEVSLNSDDELTESADILCEHNGKTCKLMLSILYGLTDETCPRCGEPVFVSDLCDYRYVCLNCDENFD